MSKPSILPCALAFMDAFAELDPAERKQTAGDVAAFLIGCREGVEEMWGEMLDLVGLETRGIGSEAQAQTLVHLLNSHHVHPGRAKVHT